ncbi:hypothetical protein CW304_16460 [Bacillus sp. UFRGS-B20]|nr:hypothetical protein CW304_16460 [Bacillus sp. UFRGS-B20]
MKGCLSCEFHHSLAIPIPLLTYAIGRFLLSSAQFHTTRPQNCMRPTLTLIIQHPYVLSAICLALRYFQSFVCHYDY